MPSVRFPNCRPIVFRADPGDPVPPSDLSTRLASLSPARRALLLERLAAQTRGPAADTRMPRVPRRTHYPLSFAQRRLWFFEQLVPGTPAYHVCHALRLRGPLDLDHLEGALQALVARHASLRTTFHEMEGEPVQRVRERSTIRLARRGVASDTAEGTERAVQDALRLESTTPFDLSAEPPFRALALQIGPADHVLALTFHHIITDGWSLAVLDRDLAELYTASAEGRDPRLPALPIDYVDFADWEQRQGESPQSRAHVHYWVQQLDGAPPLLDLATDRPRSAAPSGVGDSVGFGVPAGLQERLDAYCRDRRVTPFVALTSAWATLLHRYGCGDDLVIGTPFAGRDRPETSDVIGCFVNTLGLRVSLAGDPTFDDLAQQVHTRVIEAMPQQAAPFEKILEQLHPQRSLSQTPVFQTVVAYLSLRTDQLALPGVAAERFDSQGTSAHFDTTLSIDETAAGLTGRLTLRSDLFDIATGRRLVEHYLILLEAALREPTTQVSRLPFLSDCEYHLVVREWNRTATPYPQQTLHALFQEAAQRAPDRIALIEGRDRVTYRELDRQAEHVAGALDASGVAPGDFVGILCGRSTALVAAMLGALKVGAAYVPLDEAEPPERLDRMLDDVKPAAVLTRAAPSHRLGASGLRVLALDDALAHAPRARRAGWAETPDAVAYAMFTSGSTGRPKAVAATHRGVVRLFFGVDYAAFGENETLLHAAAPTFDASTFEVWGALLRGATCVVLPQRRPTLAEIGHAIRTHRVTTAWLTASLFNAAIDEDPESLRPLRQLLVGGEALSVEHVARALALLPETRLINGYGPTESTTFACCYPIPREAVVARASIPIGPPIGNTEAYVLDRHLAPTPVGVPGELYLGGAGLARGYVNAPDLTASRFVPHPFCDDPSARLYRTGDLVRWLPDGTLESRGRLDRQVKIRGFRVEPGEIAEALLQHRDVAQAVATVREPQPGDKRLVAFVVPRGAGVVLEPAAIEAFARARLPDYMVPSRIVTLEALPVTANGKVDLEALPHPPDADRPADAAEGPGGPLEATLLGIWRDLLRAPALGPRDNFFEWGGHSLLAARLLLRIERAVGRRLPMAALFQAPTVRAFAALLQQGESLPDRVLVPIQPRGSRSPLVVVGGSAVYRPMAARLGDDQPVLGLSLEDVLVESVELPYRVEHLARLAADALVGHRSERPIVLGGWCLDAVLAYEMARQLRADGHDVQLLLLFEPPNPALLPTLATPMNARTLVARMRFHAGRIRAIPWQDLPGYLAERLTCFGQRLGYARLQASHGASAALGRRSPRAASDVQYLASSTYRPGPYDGRTVLIACADPVTTDPGATIDEWRRLVGPGLDVLTTPGDHTTMFQEPNVETLAALVRGVLQSLLSGT